MGPGTVHEWLNGNKMIIGQYGDNVDAGYVEQKGTPKIYSLMKNGGTVFVAWYEEYDAVRFNGIGVQGDDTAWTTIEKGRELWESMTKGGFNRVYGTHPENV